MTILKYIGMSLMLVVTAGMASGLRVGWIDINQIDQVVSDANVATNKNSIAWLARTKKIKDEHDVMTRQQQEFDDHQAQWTAVERQEKQKQLDLDLTNYQHDLRILREDEALRIHQAQLDLHQKVKEIIKNIALENHIDVVVSDVWYINPQYDLTQQVLHQLVSQTRP